MYETKPLVTRILNSTLELALYIKIEALEPKYEGPGRPRLKNFFE